MATEHDIEVARIEHEIAVLGWVLENVYGVAHSPQTDCGEESEAA